MALADTARRVISLWRGMRRTKSEVGERDGEDRLSDWRDSADGERARRTDGSCGPWDQGTRARTQSLPPRSHAPGHRELQRFPGCKHAREYVPQLSRALLQHRPPRCLAKAIRASQQLPRRAVLVPEPPQGPWPECLRSADRPLCRREAPARPPQRIANPAACVNARCSQVALRQLLSQQ